MARTSSTRLSRRSLLWKWLVTLKQKGFQKFSFAKLPPALKNIKYFRQGISYGFLTSVGKENDGSSIWELSSRVRVEQ